MTWTRIAAASFLAALALAGCGTTHQTDHDYGQADEPTSVGLVACGQPTDDIPQVFATLDTAELDTLISRCDYRQTGEHCEEDELCALAVINDTHNFPGSASTGSGMR